MASSTTILLQHGTVLCHDISAGDKVTPLENTDVLIRGNIIARVGSNLDIPKDARVINCAGKIILPGFINTHHHMWTTQLKGRHSDRTLLDWIPSGTMLCYCYTPSDVFWGQLSGCLESIDAGTTCVLDHANGSYTAEHATEALRATSASGIRSIYTYAPPLRMTTWTKDACVPDGDLIPEWSLALIEEWSSRESIANGRVQIGYPFDFFSLPKETIVRTFERVRKAGVKRITSHMVETINFGYTSRIKMLYDHGLLKNDVVLSHCNGLSADEKRILKDTGIYISCTPETEGQMACGYPVALDPEFQDRATLGADIHSFNPASILSQARMLLQTVRTMDNQKLLDQDKYPSNLRGTSEQMFNMATIQGARALGMADQIGSIAEGKLADIVVFDAASSPAMTCVASHDPVTAVVRHSDTRDIDAVIIDGHVRKLDGKLVEVEVEPEDGVEKKNLDWRAIAAELVASQSAVQKRIDALSLDKSREVVFKAFGVDESKFVAVK